MPKVFGPEPNALYLIDTRGHTRRHTLTYRLGVTVQNLADMTGFRLKHL